MVTVKFAYLYINKDITRKQDIKNVPLICFILNFLRILNSIVSFRNFASFFNRNSKSLFPILHYLRICALYYVK